MMLINMVMKVSDVLVRRHSLPNLPTTQKKRSDSTLSLRPSTPCQPVALPDQPTRLRRSVVNYALNGTFVSLNC